MTPQLAPLLRDAIERTLAPKVAIAFSGGLDSTTIAKVAEAKADAQLITISVGESPDLMVAREVAAEMGLPLHEVELTPLQVLADFSACLKLMPGSAVELELMTATYALAREACRLKLDVMLMGSGAEEVFVGYHKYYEAKARGLDLDAILLEEFRTLPGRDLARTRAVCQVFGVEPRFPFMDEKLAEAVRRVPLAEKLDDGVAKKPLLRQLAAELEVPKRARMRPKKAMQYGSGLHKLMERLVKEGKLPKLQARVPEWMEKKKV
jgi:asparagine synthase (glutamine-hydrolysing)